MHRDLNSPSWQQKRHDKPLCCPCDNNTLKGRSVFCFELLGLLTAGSSHHREKRSKREAWGSPWAFWHIPPFLLCSWMGAVVTPLPLGPRREGQSCALCPAVSTAAVCAAWLCYTRSAPARASHGGVPGPTAPAPSTSESSGAFPR